MQQETQKQSKSPVRLRILAGGGLAFALVALSVTQLGTHARAEGEPEAPTALPVTVVQPEQKEIVEWDEYTGRFVATDSVEIRARVSGYLTQVAFEPGAVVQKGQLLFQVDPRPFQVTLAAARAELAGADARLSSARAEDERGKRLLERDALSREEAERRTRSYREAQAAWLAAKAQVNRAKLDLEFTKVRAPVSGRVSDDYVDEGNLIAGGVQGGTLLTTVVSIDPIEFEFTASESDYLRYLRLAAAGSRASGRVEHHPVRVRLMDEEGFDHDGRLSFVDNQLDRSTGTMRGRAVLDNPDGFFSPGMFGRLQLLGSGAYDATLIPETAIQTDQSEKFVWVATADDVAQPKRVSLGPIVDGLRVVRGGLSPDDRVIVSGTQFLRDGAQIAPHDAEPELLTQLHLR
ncbi:MAG: efflux RND transporter periplasmic adaptor subunit [Myxococcota bacterium]